VRYFEGRGARKGGRKEGKKDGKLNSYSRHSAFLTILNIQLARLKGCSGLIQEKLTTSKWLAMQAEHMLI